MGLKTIYSNIKFFIFQLICPLAKMVITLNRLEFFHAGFDVLLRRTYSVIQTMSFIYWVRAVVFMLWHLFTSILTNVNYSDVQMKISRLLVFLCSYCACKEEHHHTA